MKIGRQLMDKHLMDPWRDAFLVQLRMRDVRGTAIGDAIAEVDAHCAESGQEPAEAFGDPRQYADRIADVHQDAPDPSAHLNPPTPWWQAGLLALSTVLGVGLLLSGVDALAHGGAADTSWGAVVGALSLGVLLAAWRAGSGRLLRGRTWPLVVLVVVGPWVTVGAQMLWPQTAMALSAGTSIGLGLASVAAVWLPWLGGRWMRGDVLDDPVIDPRTGRARFTVPRWVSASFWAFPVFLLVAVLLVALIPA